MRASSERRGGGLTMLAGEARSSSEPMSVAGDVRWRYRPGTCACVCGEKCVAAPGAARSVVTQHGYVRAVTMRDRDTAGVGICVQRPSRRLRPPCVVHNGERTSGGRCSAAGVRVPVSFPPRHARPWRQQRGRAGVNGMVVSARRQKMSLRMLSRIPSRGRSGAAVRRDARCEVREG